MRVMVVHAHPVAESYNGALYNTVLDSLRGKGHEVDAIDLYAESFNPVMSREGRLQYHDVPDNITPELKPYVDRLRAAEGLVFVYPVWNYGFPAILKGYFDRVFIPGVSFVMEGGPSPDKGTLKPNLKHIRKAVFVTSYGGDRWHTMLMGDPPRHFARRWGWATFGSRLPPKFLAFYDMNNATPDRLKAFLAKVRREMERF